MTTEMELIMELQFTATIKGGIMDGQEISYKGSVLSDCDDILQVTHLIHSMKMNGEHYKLVEFDHETMHGILKHVRHMEVGG